MKKIDHLLLLAILVLMAFVSKSQDNKYRVERDIIYKITPNKDTLKLDVFLPAKSVLAKTPLIVHIHGGAWVKGDKSVEKQYYTRTLRDSLLANGFAYASINYRLLNKTTHFDQQVADIYSATKWLADNASNYHIDLTNVGIMGESAGAHLALLYAYGDLQRPALKVNYLVDVFGPTDLNALLRTNAGGLTRGLFSLLKPKIYKLRNGLLYFMAGKDIKEQPAAVIDSLARYSPLNFIDPKDARIPVLILHGNNDQVVPLKQSYQLRTSLLANGNEVDFIEVEKGNHGFTTTEKERLNELVNNTVLFIRTNSKN